MGKTSIVLRSLLLLILISVAASAQAQNILGGGEAEAKAWAAAKGYTVGAMETGKEGCFKNRRYLTMKGPHLKIRAAFFNPLYKTDTPVVAMVDFDPEVPLTQKQAEALTIQAAPIAGTRPPTHKQDMPVDGSPCAPPNGGYDGRYTEDYIAEYFYAADRARIEKVRVYNDGIR